MAQVSDPDLTTPEYKSQEMEPLENMREPSSRTKPRLSKLRRASALLRASPGYITAPAHRGQAGLGAGRARRPILPTSSTPRSLRACLLQLLAVPNNWGSRQRSAPIGSWPFRFRPTLHSPPIICASGYGPSPRPSLRILCLLRPLPPLLPPPSHLLRQAASAGGPRGGGGGGGVMEPGAGGRGTVRGHGAGPPGTPPPQEQERKLEQEKLSGVVKSVHRRLRKKYREGKRRAGRGGRAARAPRPWSPLPSPRGHHCDLEELHVSPAGAVPPGSYAPSSAEPTSAAGALLPPPLPRGPLGRGRACGGPEAPTLSFPRPCRGAEIVSTLRTCAPSRRRGRRAGDVKGQHGGR